MKDHVEILVGLTLLIAVVYRVFQIESAIYNAIDDSEKRVNERINSLERSFALHVAIYALSQRAGGLSIERDRQRKNRPQSQSTF